MTLPPDHLYPFSNNYLEVRGLRMHYLDEGPRDAPPVLMLHGNPTWSFYYRNLVRALCGEFRCIVPDHIGCGLSDKPGDDAYDYRLKSDYVEFLAARECEVLRSEAGYDAMMAELGLDAELVKNI